MAKPTYNKKKAAPETVNYREAVAALKSEGPKRLYLLFGRDGLDRLISWHCF